LYQHIFRDLVRTTRHAFGNQSVQQRSRENPDLCRTTLCLDLVLSLECVLRSGKFGEIYLQDLTDDDLRASKHGRETTVLATLLLDGVASSAATHLQIDQFGTILDYDRPEMIGMC